MEEGKCSPFPHHSAFLPFGSPALHTRTHTLTVAILHNVLSKVTTEDKVLGDSPYLLFYERENLDHEKFFSKVTKGVKNDEDSDSEEGTDDDRCVVQ